ncbi:hypothetical protein GCM10020295_46840 [Streptomyces cinereospinus]
MAAVSGALALSAAVAPAAQAAPVGPLDGGYGDTKITKVVVDGDNKVSMSTSGARTITVSVTATDDSGIAGADSFDLVGPGYGYESTSRPACKAVNATTSTCTASVTVDPRTDAYWNSNAGTWYVGAWIDAEDGDFLWKEKAGSFHFQRATRLTANAAPEPVKKGATLTVTGKLTRANWETLTYGAYAGQSVTLQFRKRSATAYSDVKTVRTNTKGDLKTTVQASVDGYYRYVFKGNSSHAAVNATGDFVDVR